LPTLRRILGRQRNMVALPNGERRWPLVGFARYREVADIVQYQIVQHSLDEIEMRFVLGSGVLSDAQAASLAQIVQRNLRHPFTVRFTRFDAELPGTRSGKFEEFVSLLD
jgi:phenylacetate-CoA ligase